MSVVETALQINKPAEQYFKSENFVGLDEDAISILNPALEQSKTIERFANDEFVTDNAKKPSLYKHIINGLEYAREKIFTPLNRIEGIDKIAENFNKAFLVHDFGEMIKEFSTFYGRFNNLEDKNFPRDQVERSIAEMILTFCKLGVGKFEDFIQEAKKISIESMDDIKILLESNVAKIKKLKNSSLALLNLFVENWMEYFDLSQNKDSLKKSFVGNLVKVVDKLETQDTTRSLHDPNKLKNDSNFARAKILNYLKAYKGLQESIEAENSKPQSPEKNILDLLDKLIRKNFQRDNSLIDNSFKNFESALTESDKFK
jgi:hypothetical protein